MKRSASVRSTPVWSITTSLFALSSAVYLFKAAQLTLSIVTPPAYIPLNFSQYDVMTGAVATLCCIPVAARWWAPAHAVWMALAAGVAGVAVVAIRALELTVPLRTALDVGTMIAAGVAYALGVRALRWYRLSGYAYVTEQTPALVGLVTHVIAAVLFLPVGLMVPLWGMAVLYILWWLALRAMRWCRTRYPLLVPAIPPLTFWVMYRLVLLGGEVFSWTA
jgi:hypothetical protein